MNNYLISYVLITSYYMDPKTKRQDKTAMVEAESEKLAEETLKKHWDNMSDQYSVTYNVYDSDVALSLKQSEILLPEKKK